MSAGRRGTASDARETQPTLRKRKTTPRMPVECDGGSVGSVDRVTASETQ